MTQDELKKIATKIAKCLALASSDNPAEAEAAKRQAEALMKKYNMTSGDAAAAQVHEKQGNTGGKHRAPVYLCSLAGVIAKAFSCGLVFSPGGGYKESYARFFGLGIKPDLAAYTFDVLRRQLIKDRAAYSATLKRYKRANKIRMADIFADTWVRRVSQQAREFAGTEQEQKAIEAYEEKQWGSSLITDTRSGAAPKRDSDYLAIAAGFAAASDVSLHRPVQTKRGSMLNHAG